MSFFFLFISVYPLVFKTALSTNKLYITIVIFLLEKQQVFVSIIQQVSEYLQCEKKQVFVSIIQQVSEYLQCTQIPVV
jgi:hypothetical protein